jgi:methylthioribose-1-phosphate isomerase
MLRSLNKRPAFCSRPTAVNLQDASFKLSAALDAVISLPQATPESVTGTAIAFAEGMREADIACNREIGKHGMHAIIAEVNDRGRRGGGGLRVLTHCNTGSLATVQYGTALGCIRALHENGKLERAFCTETRCAPLCPTVCPLKENETPVVRPSIFSWLGFTYPLFLAEYW